MRPFSVKIGNLELRTCGIHLCSSGDLETAEIVNWDVDSCITIAYWDKDQNLQFVGDRFIGLSMTDFMRLAEIGQTFLKE